MSEESVARRRKVTTKQRLMAHEQHPEQTLVPYDENLLERARNQWQFGDWLRLTQISEDALQHHPERAKLALLAAAAHLQVGNALAAKQLLRLARGWGCGDKLLRRVLIAGVYNSIGRAYSATESAARGMPYFEKAIEVGMPGSDIRLLAKARAGYQLEDLGLTPGSEGRLQQLSGIASLSHGLSIPAAPTNAKPLAPVNADAMGFYQRLNTQASEDISTPFVLIDSKSLPRSGLHYLRNTFARVLGDSFSFCEWYNETGCCKSHPCALTGYATFARQNTQFRLRMTKSHDFELTDPPLHAGPHLRRLVLLRDPLFILTSWFCLDQLGAYRAILQRQGIDMRKIWLSHEKEVLASAYQVFDEHFIAPETEKLASWLTMKTQYIARFLEKWVLPAMESPNRYISVVRYEDIDQYVGQLVGEFLDYLPDDTHARISAAANSEGARFRRRGDPFSAPTKSLTEYLSKQAPLFEMASRKVSDIEGLSQLF
ncbi:MAG: hypothetical protein JNM98_21395 [Rhodocyclaceae bacterium]|nr:hypothetical protein [Rhodocyclaceae bacterium]